MASSIPIPCPRCSGTGTDTHEDRHAETGKDTCSTCGGARVVPSETGETQAGSFDPVSGRAFGDGAPAHGTTVRFAAGDAVPEWILRVEGEASVTFKEAATAECHADGSVTVTARQALGVLRVEGTKPDGQVKLIGAPTCWKILLPPIPRLASFECTGSGARSLP